MLSESQERMLAVLKPGREAEAARIFEKWELDFAVIGVTTDTKRLVVKHKGAVVADIPVNALSDEAPIYERPFVKRPPRSERAASNTKTPALDALAKMLASPDMCSRRWVWEQYDHTVMADTAQRPGGDAAVVRVHGTKKALAITTDVTPRYCKADPFEGAKQAVAEAWRNLNAVGATPLAVTDNLNFGNPEKPEIMGEIVSGVEGIGDACRALDFPVVSGNCSLYNETNGEAILPTPAIGAVGLLNDVHRMATVAFKRTGDAIILIGETKGHLGQSIYLREVEGREEGAAPHVDLVAEKHAGEFVRTLIASGRTDTVHDLSDGGLLVAIAEMAMAGNIGAAIDAGSGMDSAAWFFGEDQARYVIGVKPTETAWILTDAEQKGIPALLIGMTGGSALKVDGEGEVSLSILKRVHESWFPAYMRGEEVPAAN
jgi:phosphoribosylformylglycinamidine synthase II